METRGPAAIDAIMAALKPSVNAWDGPILTGDYSDAVYIGYDADPDGEEQATATTQKWAGIGQRKRDEDIIITCAAVALTGEDDDSWQRPRNAAYTLLETVGQILRSDPSFNQTPPFVAELWPGDYFQENGPAGYQARVVFAIHIVTRV